MEMEQKIWNDFKEKIQLEALDDFDQTGLWICLGIDVAATLATYGFTKRCLKALFNDGKNGFAITCMAMYIAGKFKYNLAGSWRKSCLRNNKRKAELNEVVEDERCES